MDWLSKEGHPGKSSLILAMHFTKTALLIITAIFWCNCTSDKLRLWQFFSISHLCGCFRWSADNSQSRQAFFPRTGTRHRRELRQKDLQNLHSPHGCRPWLERFSAPMNASVAPRERSSLSISRRPRKIHVPQDLKRGTMFSWRQTASLPSTSTVLSRLFSGFFLGKVGIAGISFGTKIQQCAGKKVKRSSLS